MLWNYSCAGDVTEYFSSMGWVGLGQEYLIVGGLGWVEGMMGWVGLGYEIWTHGHVCSAEHCHVLFTAAYIKESQLL